ncbi:hypothetical protein CO2235_U670050 [Cupriavidus oxalaticus]|uniref:Uncharacterized protein n=1 Tax=Cupriavidus oxalaticus TaxID=96344 RepID=A0A375FQ56_9BURK|nr:hypothetical protein CO2235_U670050 [Cupriavidus oxalaticus]
MGPADALVESCGVIASLLIRVRFATATEFASAHCFAAAGDCRDVTTLVRPVIFVVPGTNFREN